MADPARPQIRKFGTFGGVFTPDVLTILGVIMYLRLGWVVGNAGLLGALGIILLAKSVTICTGLSMSSITTNIRIGAGGAYSIIAKSLGLEAGGSIGIPLYIAQTLSAALYLIGFTEAWMRVFPVHDPLLVACSAWAGLMAVTFISTQFAIKIQYVIMTILGLSLVSFMLSRSQPVPAIVLIPKTETVPFWTVFAVFFPAVTGIMAGANMSGDLYNPRRSIPLGTMLSIGVTMLIYMGLAYAIARISTPEEMRANQMLMVDKALWGPVVIAGIMGATLSSALGSILGAPRILQALSEQKTVPLHRFFSKKSKANEPYNALGFTGLLVVLSLVLFYENLNAIATLITMFFLITYGMLNLVVFIEQGLKFISFRPTFRIPRIVPFIGAVMCIAIMFLINPVFSVVSLAIIISLYIWLASRGLQANWGDIRGGLFLVLAERASRLAARFPRHHISWKPDLLLPIDDPKIWRGPLLFIRNITYPSGSISAFTVKQDAPEETQQELDQLLQRLRDQDIMVHSTVIEDERFLHGAKIVIQTLTSTAFRPNILFLTVGDDPKKDYDIRELVSYASTRSLGTILLLQHPRMAFGMQKTVNLWLRDRSPNWHLAMLVTLQLQMNWGGRINLITVADDEMNVVRLHAFLGRLSDQARLPALTEFHVLTGSFREALNKAPRADINIMGLASDTLPLTFIREVPEAVNSSCIFVKDSGQENALV